MDDEPERERQKEKKKKKKLYEQRKLKLVSNEGILSGWRALV